MLSVVFDEKTQVATLTPHGALSKTDFLDAARLIDPLILQHGQLCGIIIYTSAFPGWETFGALVSHLRFVHDHHKKVVRVALVTDSPFAPLVQHLASHFVQAEIQAFPFSDYMLALRWIVQDKQPPK